MTTTIVDGLSLQTLRLIEISQVNPNSQIALILVDIHGTQTLLSLEDYVTDRTIKRSCLRLADVKTLDILDSEVHQCDKYELLNAILTQTTSQFDNATNECILKMDMPQLPTLIFDIPFLRNIDSYWFSFKKDTNFLDFFETINANKKVYLRDLPQTIRKKILDSDAFKRMKLIEIGYFCNISIDQFMKSEAEHLLINTTSNMDEALNLKLKKWISNEDVKYNQIQVRGYTVNWNTVLEGLDIYKTNDKGGYIEYIMRRSDGIFAKLYCEDCTFIFKVIGKSLSVTEGIPQFSSILPVNIFCEITKHFDLQTQRRLAQTCKTANEFVRKTNDIWPINVEYRQYDRNMIILEFKYKGGKTQTVLIEQQKNGYMTIEPGGSSPNRININIYAYKYMATKFEAFQYDKRFRRTIRVIGEIWPERIFKLKYFKEASRYECDMHPRLFGPFVNFLGNVDNDKEVVLRNAHDLKENEHSELTEEFFESAIFKRMKHWEIDGLSMMTPKQFISCEAEVLHIKVPTMIEAAVRRKINKWVNNQQDIKCFSIIMPTHRGDTTNIDEVIDDLPVVEQSFDEPDCSNFVIRREDGEKADLAITTNGIVFSTFVYNTLHDLITEYDQLNV